MQNTSTRSSTTAAHSINQPALASRYVSRAAFPVSDSAGSVPGTDAPAPIAGIPAELSRSSIVPPALEEPPLSSPLATLDGVRMVSRFD